MNKKMTLFAFAAAPGAFGDNGLDYSEPQCRQSHASRKSHRS
jgi:hypothetical protein